MKKLFLLFILSLFSIVALMGCAESGADDNQREDTANDAGEELEGEETAHLSGTITMAGSTSVQPLSEELAAVFMNNHPDVRIEVAGGGSGAGVQAAQENTADFGAVSREIAEDETGIETHTIAIDGIAIIVHPDNPVEDLSLDDIQRIFSGEIANWSEIGGNDEEVVVVSREDGSGTRGAFTDIVLGDVELIGSALIQNSTGAVRESVSTEVNAIGYVSLGGLNDTVKGLLIDGAEPTPEAITSGEYAVSRPFNYVSNETEALSDVTQAFLDFALSTEGQQVVEENGFIAVN
ncbi:phosphate ABC transporter substrate-binding protein [Amphibacillus sp. Q70]|uniref:phosphate ABC transporter substrate-binding protein n=1 Tax=Amphibacillus sp. Q70 TaxID=3453416 RepID=UPI003F8584F3